MHYRVKHSIPLFLFLFNMQLSSGVHAQFYGKDVTKQFSAAKQHTTRPADGFNNTPNKAKDIKPEAKHRLNHMSIAITNSVNSFPITGYPAVFYSQFHPGLTLGTGFKWKEGKKTDFTQTFKMGCFFHRYIQNAAMLYTETGIRRKAADWGFSAMLGLGYLHSFPATQRFQLNPGSGEYEKIRNLGRPQGMFGFTLGIDRKINAHCRGFVRFQTIIQTPFVSGYIPVLPINQLHAGISMPWPFVRKEKAQ
jgi:hypothetical protein